MYLAHLTDAELFRHAESAAETPLERELVRRIVALDLERMRQIDDVLEEFEVESPEGLTHRLQRVDDLSSFASDARAWLSSAPELPEE